MLQVTTDPRPAAGGVRSLHVLGRGPAILPKSRQRASRLKIAKRPLDALDFTLPCPPNGTRLGFEKMAKAIVSTSLPFLNHLFRLQEPPKHRISSWRSMLTGHPQSQSP